VGRPGERLARRLAARRAQRRDRLHAPVLLCGRANVKRFAAEAERRLKRNDKAREAYVRHYHGAEARDPRLYHLVIDSTSIPLKACVELILVGVRAREGVGA
jgi:cytidylate kinase